MEQNTNSNQNRLERAQMARRKIEPWAAQRAPNCPTLGDDPMANDEKITMPQEPSDFARGLANGGVMTVGLIWEIIGEGKDFVQALSEVEFYWRKWAGANHVEIDEKEHENWHPGRSKPYEQ
jgi:hypothetical protein